MQRTPSARNSRPRMKIFALKRSLGVSAGLYQSVMMTPPNGSADASGMNDTVSSVARQRKLLTPTPDGPPSPPPPPPPPLLGLSLLPNKLEKIELLCCW